MLLKIKKLIKIVPNGLQSEIKRKEKFNPLRNLILLKKSMYLKYQIFPLKKTSSSKAKNNKNKNHLSFKMLDKIKESIKIKKFNRFLKVQLLILLQLATYQNQCQFVKNLFLLLKNNKLKRSNNKTIKMVKMRLCKILYIKVCKKNWSILFNAKFYKLKNL